MKYIKLFNNITDYQQFIGGGDYITPNVCLNEETGEIFCEPYSMFPIYLNGEFELSYNDWGFKQYNMIIDISNTNIYNIFYDKLMTIEPDETGNRFFSDDFLEKNQIYINGKKIIHANKDIFASNFIWIYIDDFFNNDILVGEHYYRLYPDRIELFEGETL